MILPDTARLTAATHATWPAFSTHRVGAFTVREGRGAGRRVSAATAPDDANAAEIGMAVQAMRDLGQEPVFSLPEGAQALDAALVAAGFTGMLRNDFMAAPVEVIGGHELPRVGAFPLWPPLAIVEHIWAETEIDAARRRVIEAVLLPKTAVLARANDKPAGALFIAADGDVAMPHAVVTRPALRRHGAARFAMIAAARWAAQQGCRYIGLAVTAENAPAIRLYEGLGMSRVGGYHYRMLPKGRP